MEKEKKEKYVQEMKNENNESKISSGWKLVGLCLKSKSFDLLFVLMIGVVWYGVILLRQYTYGKDSTVALLAIYVFPILVGVFFVVMFGSMRYITRKMQKSFSAEILFAIVTILIPIFIFFYFPLDF